MKQTRRLKQNQMTGLYFDQGVAAGKSGSADACPYPTGVKRNEWLAGFFSVRESPERMDLIAFKAK
jgi:ribosome modulation factor